MKKALIIMATLLIAVGAGAQVKWHTVEEASEAKIGTKLYFVDFYTTWCGYCKKMDRETFTDATVSKLLNKFYYPAKFNAESAKPITWKGRTYRVGNDGRRRVHEFAVATLGARMGFPTFAIFSADGRLIQAVPGYYPAKDFVVVLWYFASGDYQRYPFERYQQIFDKEIRPEMEKQLK